MSFKTATANYSHSKINKKKKNQNINHKIKIIQNSKPNYLGDSMPEMMLSQMYQADEHAIKVGHN